MIASNVKNLYVRFRAAVRPSFSVLLTFISVCSPLVQAKQGIFDGFSLAGWEVMGDARWSVTNGVLTALGSDGYLATESRYDSYRLQIEFKIDPGTNSGIFVQCQNRENISPLTCFEINIWDAHPRPEYSTGAIVTLKPPLHKIDTLGGWNRYDILVASESVKVVLNDVLVSSLDAPDKTSGFIALQRSGQGKVSFREISLVPLNQRKN